MAEKSKRAKTAKARPGPVTFAEVRRMALALPGVAEKRSYGTPGFRVGKRFFFRLRDDGETLAVRIDFDTREALLMGNPAAFFITEHHRGYPAICVRLSAVRRPELESLLKQSWKMEFGPSNRG